MANVGFSTGILYKSSIPLDERIILYHSLGADAIELGFATSAQLFEYDPSEQTERILREFPFVSIHAPWKEITYKDDAETTGIIMRLKAWRDRFPIKGIVLHPDTVSNFDILARSVLPFLLENMDRRKKVGTHPEHFKEFRKYGFGFVLDVEHAYEQDPTMHVARELIEVMGDRLNHMHVSGRSDSELHVPVNCAANKKAITQVLEMRLDVPKIGEGIATLLQNPPDSITQELEYLRRFES